MEILLVFELILMSANTSRKGDINVSSGGYGYTKIFEIDSKQSMEMINLIQGSPRDLLALVDKSNQASDSYISFILTQNFTRFDNFMKLIPGECLIN